MNRVIQNIGVHCTATPQTTTVDSILRYWKETLRWNSPGYHVLIEADGTVHFLHDFDKVANGVRGFNSHSIHVSYIGGIDTNGSDDPEDWTPLDNRTPEQKIAMAAVIGTLHGYHPNAHIKGHRDFSPDIDKACPSFDVSEWLMEIGIQNN